MSYVFGWDRGTPVDRYYIEGFLTESSSDVQGCVLEIADPAYTRRFGGARVTRSEVLHVQEGNSQATIVGDLTNGENLPSDTFDCIILTQTLVVIYDVRAALRTVFRILKPGGVLLMTVPGITYISREDMQNWGQYWSFTTRSTRNLLEEIAPDADIQVAAHGNVLATTAFLYGLAAEELRRRELDHRDPMYEFLITARVVKPVTSTA